MKEWKPRVEQLPPESDWATWIIVGDRASGKSRTAAEYILSDVCAAGCAGLEKAG